MEPCALITTTGNFVPCLANSLRTSIPPILGIWRSRSISSGSCFLISARASGPSATAATVHSIASSRTRKSRREAPSSSTISTRVAVIAISGKLRLRSEEHTSELQSQSNLVCRLLLEKKKDIAREVLQVAPELGQRRVGGLGGALVREHRLVVRGAVQQLRVRRGGGGLQLALHRVGVRVLRQRTLLRPTPALRLLLRPPLERQRGLVVHQHLRELDVLLVPHFFFNVPATTVIYTLSLHDALPI